MEEKERERERVSDLMRAGRLEQASALPQQGCSSVSSWMLLLVTHVHFNPQVSVVHATPMLLFLFIYMLPEVNTSQALEDTALYAGEERRASRTPSSNGEALFMSLHVLSQCWQTRVFCVPWWVLLKSWFGSWGGQNPRRGLLSAGQKPTLSQDQRLLR